MSQPAPGPWQDCPTPEKVKFLDLAGAERHITRIARMAAQHRPGRPEFVQGHRPYRCPCGLWHVTTKGRPKPKVDPQ